MTTQNPAITSHHTPASASTALFAGYYVVLGAVVIASALYTVAQSSRVVLYGQTVAELQTEKQTLEHQKGLLQKELAESVALAQVQETAETENFVTINSTIKVNANTAVAVRP